jgi:hypothetical protein
MARYNVRCSHEACRARDVFRKHPDEYSRPRKCRVCGGKRFRVVSDRVVDRCGAICACRGYHFTHRRGSFFCWHRKDGSGRYPGDADFHDRWGDAA